MVTYKKLKYNNADVVQVRSAQKDANGLQIDTGYVRHAVFEINTNNAATNVSTSSLGLGSKSPRLVQIFNESGDEVNADVVISSTSITINLIGAPANKTWTGHVTAW